MKKFIQKSLLFFGIVITLMSSLLLIYGDYVDFFYNKFTSPKAVSMIIGDSRGLQGFQPEVMNNALNETNVALPVLNYSFTIAQAHIGPLYRKSILKKINPETKNGIFVIAISPWMLGSKKANDNYQGEFKEVNEPPHNMVFVNSNPNYEYLLRNMSYFNFKGIFRKNSKLHKNGWLEAKNLPTDSVTFNNWKQSQLNIFSGFKRDYDISDYRIKSLDTLITDLKGHGSIYLVRTPINNDMLELENSFFENFDSLMEQIKLKHNIEFYNFTRKGINEMYATYDGHHLNKIGGKLLSKVVCDSIKLNLKNRN